MDTFFNNVGRGVCAAIKLSNARIYKGSPLWLQWYGRYDMNSSTWSKIKLVLRNG